MKVLQSLLIVVIRLYRWVLSPMKLLVFGPLGRCRFTPSCSEYALGAVGRHGAWRGSWLAAQRICRCHPWGGCGHDPVPPPKSETQVPHSACRAPHSKAQRPGSKVFARPGLRLDLPATAPMVMGGDRR